MNIQQYQLKQKLFLFWEYNLKWDQLYNLFPKISKLTIFYLKINCKLLTISYRFESLSLEQNSRNYVFSYDKKEKIAFRENFKTANLLNKKS